MSKTTYTVELLSFAKKDLKGLWQIKDEIVRRLLELEKNPNKGHDLSGNLQGVKSLEFNIKGSGQYRAGYVVQENEKICSIVAIGTHENFYEFLSKRVKLIKSLLEKTRKEF